MAVFFTAKRHCSTRLAASQKYEAQGLTPHETPPGRTGIERAMLMSLRQRRVMAVKAQVSGECRARCELLQLGMYHLAPM